MKRERHGPDLPVRCTQTEQIIHKLRAADRIVSEGKDIMATHGLNLLRRGDPGGLTRLIRLLS